MPFGLPAVEAFLHSSTSAREDVEQMNRNEMRRRRPGRVAWSGGQEEVAPADSKCQPTASRLSLVCAWLALYGRASLWGE